MAATWPGLDSSSHSTISASSKGAINTLSAALARDTPGHGRPIPAPTALALVDLHALIGAVIGLVHLDNQVAVGERAGGLDRLHVCFGARRGEAHSIKARNARAEDFGQLHLPGVWGVPGSALGHAVLHGRNDVGVRVAVNDGRGVEGEIHQLIAVNIGQCRAAARCDVGGIRRKPGRRARLAAPATIAAPARAAPGTWACAPGSGPLCCGGHPPGIRLETSHAPSAPLAAPRSAATCSTTHQPRLWQPGVADD